MGWPVHRSPTHPGSHEDGRGDSAPDPAARPHPRPYAPPDGSGEAFSRFAHARRTHIAQALARLGVPRDDCGDVTQQVLLAAYTSLGAFDPSRGSWKAWLAAITLHQARHFLEKAYHRREDLVGEAGRDTIDEREGADEEIEVIERAAQVRAVLASMPEELRRVLVATKIEGRPMAEIAGELGLPISTAYKRYYRARAAFARAWQEAEDDARPPAARRVRKRA